MVPSETGRREFLLGATSLAVGDSATRLGTVISAVGLPGVDSDHAVRWTFDGGDEAMVFPVARDRKTVFATVREDRETAGRGEGPTVRLYALSATSGEVRWKQTLNGRPTIPKTEDGLVFVTDHEQLYAFAAADGTKRWQTDYDRQRLDALLVEDGAIFVNHESGVRAIDAESGRQRWATDLGDDRLSLPVFSRGKVYVGGREGFYALSKETGRQQWHASTLDGPVWAKGVRDGLLVGWGESVVYAYGVENGTKQWRTPYEGLRPYGSIGTIDDRGVYVWGESFAGFDLRTGERRWTFETEANRGYTPTAAGGRVFFPVRGGEFVALDAKSGREQWRFDIEDLHGYWGAPKDGLVYVLGSQTAYALDANSGDEVWSLDLGDDRGLWADVAGGLAFVGTRKGKLYAIDRPSPFATAPVATAERFATSPPGIGLLGLVGAGLLGVGYRRATATDDADPGLEFGRLERLDSGPVTETYRKRVRTPDGPALVAETRLTDENYREAFETAVEQWAALDCDGVLPIREFGTDPTWFETPFPAGGSLADSWPVARRERVEVVSGVARTLHATHREGVTHGRLAPRHVHLNAPGEGRGVRVGGWFLDAALPDARDDPYAPPEIETRAETDAQADLYRVGALATHLLTGAVPKSDATAASLCDRGVSAGVAEVLAQALAADPNDRHESALAFDDAFRWVALER